MKNIRTFFFLSVIYIFLFTGCSGSCRREGISGMHNSSVVRISVNIENDKPVKLSSLFSQPQMKLLKMGSCPIGRINKLKIFNDTIYILSDLKLFIYDKNGSFVRVIDRNGRGPTDYLTLSDFFVNSDGSIEILDFRGKKMLKYDSSGAFIEDWETGMYAFSFIKKDGNYLFFGGNSNKATRFSSDMVYVFNKWKGNMTGELFTVDVNQSGYLNYIDTRNLQMLDRNIYLGFSPNDTIFCYTGKEVNPKYIIDFGKRKIDKKVFSQKFDDILAFNSYLSDKDLCHYVNNFLLSPGLVFFNFLYKDRYWTCAYLSLTGEVFSSDLIYDDMILKGEAYKSSAFFPYEYYNDGYYFLIQPYQIRDYIEKNGPFKSECFDLKADDLNNIKIEDNPVLIKFRLK